MEKANYRRIIQLGKTTHCISLPKAWLKKYGLEKGDTAMVYSKPNGDLIISQEGNSQINDNEITIDTAGKDIEKVKRDVISAYINNYSKITLTGENIIAQLSEMHKVLEVLTATEIMKAEKNQIVIKSFFDAHSASIKNILTRLNMMVISMFNHIKTVISHDITDYGFLKREKEINRLCFMGFRVLSCSLHNANIGGFAGKDERSFISTWMFIDKLEKVADRLYMIGNLLKESKTLQKSESHHKTHIIEYLSNVERVYKGLLQSFNKHDREAAHKIIDQVQELANMHRERIMKHHNKIKPIKPPSRHCILIFEKIDRINTIMKHMAMTIVDREPIH